MLLFLLYFGDLGIGTPCFVVLYRNVAHIVAFFFYVLMKNDKSDKKLKKPIDKREKA